MTPEPEKPAGWATRFSFAFAPGVATAGAFALSDVLIKVILGVGCDVLTMLLLRSIVGLAVMAAWLQVGAKSIADARIRRISLISGVLFAGSTFCLFKAIEVIDVPTAVLSYFVYPLFTGLAASAVGLDQFRWRGVAFAIVALFGLAVMVGAHPGDFAFMGLVYAIGAACFRTAMLITTRAFLVGADARITTWYSQISCTAVFLIASVATWTWTGPQTVGGWIELLALGISTTSGVLFLFVSTVRIGPIRTALLMYLEPLLTMLLSAIVLSEIITPVQGLGSAIMLAGLVAFQLWH